MVDFGGFHPDQNFLNFGRSSGLLSKLRPKLVSSSGLLTRHIPTSEIGLLGLKIPPFVFFRHSFLAQVHGNLFYIIVNRSPLLHILQGWYELSLPIAVDTQRLSLSPYLVSLVDLCL